MRATGLRIAQTGAATELKSDWIARATRLTIASIDSPIARRTQVEMSLLNASILAAIRSIDDWIARVIPPTAGSIAGADRRTGALTAASARRTADRHAQTPHRSKGTGGRRPGRY
jgi:hypothetical protein